MLSVFFVLNFILAQSGTIEIENDKYGIIDRKTKKQISEFIYDDIEILMGTGYLVMLNDKIGLLDKSGKEVFSCIYEDIHQVLDNPNFVVIEDVSSTLSVHSLKDNKLVFSKFTADMRHPLCGPYDEFTGSITKTIIAITKNGKSGILELPAKIILPIEYDKIIACESKRGVVILKKRGKYRFYNLKDKTLLSPEFELNGNEGYLPVRDNFCHAEASDYFPVDINGKWGIMNMLGKFSIQPRFDKLKISPYTEIKKAFIVVYRQNQWYTYNYGKLKLFDIHHFLGFWNNYAVTIKNEKVLFFDKKGSMFLEIKLKNPHESKIKTFQKNNKYGVISHKSKLIVDFEYQFIEIIKNRMAAQKNNKFALLNPEGKALSTFKYDEITLISSKPPLLRIKQYGKYGLMNFDGSEIVKPKYIYISGFSNGKATAKLYKTEFEIDTKGNKLN